MKTSSIELAKPRKGGVRVGGDSKARYDGSEINDNKIDSSKVGDDEFGKKVQKMSKSKKTIGFSDFLILETKLAFNELKKAFFKALLLHYFDLEYHIRTEMDVSGYAIGEVLSQLTSDNLGQ